MSKDNSDFFKIKNNWSLIKDKLLGCYLTPYMQKILATNKKKCIEKGNITKKDKFDNCLSPEFFVFANHGIGNCYLWQRVSDEGFHVKIKGYQDVADFIFNNIEINIDNKVYPLMFMLRNTLELCLKRLFMVE